MKKVILAIVAGFTFAGVSSQACEGGLYKGSLETAQLLQKTEVVCSYNGEQDDAAVVNISVPRCMGARPSVELEVFGDVLQVQKIQVKTIRGIARYTKKFVIETLETDLPVVCTEPVVLRRP